MATRMHPREYFNIPEEVEVESIQEGSKLDRAVDRILYYNGPSPSRVDPNLIFGVLGILGIVGLIGFLAYLASRN